MYEVFAATRHHRPSVWAAVDTDGDVRALFTPVSITVVGGPLRSLTTRSVAFAGPLVRPTSTDARPLDLLLRAYRSAAPRSSVFTEIRNVADGTTFADTLAANGFRHEAHLNFLLDLQDDDDRIWGRVAPSAAGTSARRAGWA